MSFSLEARSNSKISFEIKCILIYQSNDNGYCYLIVMKLLWTVMTIGFRENLIYGMNAMVCDYIHVYVYICVCICLCIYVFVYVYVCMYIYVYIYIFIYIYIYIYIAEYFMFEVTCVFCHLSTVRFPFETLGI